MISPADRAKFVEDTLEILTKEEKISLSYFRATLRGRGHYLPSISIWKNIHGYEQEKAMLDLLQAEGFTVLQEGKDPQGNPFSVERNSEEYQAMLLAQGARFRSTYITL